MTLYQAELKYYLRSPVIWLIVAVSAFIAAWSFLLSIELFTTLQVKFAGMSDAPTIVQGIVFPLLSAQSKILIIIVAIVAGLSFSRLSNNNSWSLITSAQMSDWKIIQHKYLAVLFVCLIFILPAIVAILSLMFIVGLQILPVFIALVGLLLLLLWMLALGLLLSSLVNNTGFAILLCIVSFMLLWLLSQSAIDAEWGKNWIQVFTPFYHFKQFTTDTISWASVFYFLTGTVLFLWMTKIRLMQKRYCL